MLKGLRALVGKTQRVEPAKTPARSAAPKPATASGDYRAVSVAPGKDCCAAANATAGKRYLFREAPRLPLDDCTMAPSCSCKFKKVSDRRGRDRRQVGAIGTGREFEGPENRKQKERRSEKD
ncbi:MAG: hypothetical protein WA825_09230 [Steroidobacteraceae bacterium]